MNLKEKTTTTIIAIYTSIRKTKFNKNKTLRLKNL